MKLLVSKGKKHIKFWLYIYAFLIIYNPQFFKNYNSYLNYSLSFIYWILGVFILNSSKIKTKIFIERDFNKKLITNFGVLAMVFFCLRTVVSGTSIFDFFSLRIVQSLSFIVCVLSFCNLSNYIERNGLSKGEQIDFILKVSMIQFFFVLLMILFPSFRMKILNYIYITSKRNFTFTIAKRVYGVMNNYTFSGSVFHGILAFIALYWGYTTNQNKYYIYIPFLLIMIFLNGRIGLIIFILAIFIFLLYNLIRLHNINRILKLLFFLAIICGIAITVLPVIWPYTYSFFVNGFYEIFSFAQTGVASSEYANDVDDLYGQLIADFNLKTFFIGNGHKIQNAADIPNGVFFTKLYSDMGFLNDMYMGGVLYMFLLRYPIIRIIFNDNKDNYNSSNLIFNIVLVLILIVSNLKGEVYRSPIIVGAIVYIKYAVNSMNFNKDNYY